VRSIRNRPTIITITERRRHSGHRIDCLILSDTSTSTLDTSFGGLRDVSMVDWFGLFFAGSDRRADRRQQHDTASSSRRKTTRKIICEKVLRYVCPRNSRETDRHWVGARYSRSVQNGEPVVDNKQWLDTITTFQWITKSGSKKAR